MDGYAGKNHPAPAKDMPRATRRSGDTPLSNVRFIFKQSADDPRLFASTQCGARCGYRRADLKKSKKQKKFTRATITNNK
jgi:hypothetical protein